MMNGVTIDIRQDNTRSKLHALRADLCVAAGVFRDHKQYYEEDTSVQVVCYSGPVYESLTPQYLAKQSGR